MDAFVRIEPYRRVFSGGKDCWQADMPVLINTRYIVSIVIGVSFAQIKMRGRQVFYVPVAQLVSLVGEK